MTGKAWQQLGKVWCQEQGKVWCQEQEMDRSQSHPYTGSRKKTGSEARLQTLKVSPFCSISTSMVLHLKNSINFLNTTTNWETSVQIHEPMGRLSPTQQAIQK